MLKKIGLKLFLLFISLGYLWGDAHIYIYHRFNDARYPSTNISNANLRAQFEFFKQNNYEIIPLSKLVNAIKNGEKISDKWVVLTIDDGYKSFYENALPIFKEYGYTFALMVYVEASAKRYGDFMSFDQIKEAAKYGEIGYHSYAHPHMVGLNEQKLRDDFAEGLKVFEKHMGYKPKYFAYPFGEYNDKVKKIATEYGLEVLLNQNSGAVSALSDVLDLDRTPLMDDTILKIVSASKFLKAEWILPKDYPKNAKLDEIIVKTDENATSGDFYITGYGTQRVKLENGEMKLKFDKPIEKYKIRMSLKVNGKTTTKILVKDINAE